MKAVLAIFLSLILLSCVKDTNDSVLIATASSFRPALEKLVPKLSTFCNVDIRISSGSSGGLITQVLQGAPFAVLISADLFLSKTLENSPNNYQFDPPFARSPMAYWQTNNDNKSNAPIAIANPKTTPFGKAAMQVIGNNKPALALAANAEQAFVFVDTAAAKAGYVPYVLLLKANIPAEQYKLIPQANYTPILLHSIRLSNTPAATCIADQLNAEQIKFRLSELGYLQP